MNLNHIQTQPDLTPTNNRQIKELLEENFRVKTEDYSSNAMFMTEDDDHEFFPIDERPGLESVERQQWVESTLKQHGRMTRFKGSKAPIPFIPQKDPLEMDVDPYRESLHADTLPILDGDGNPIDADEPLDMATEERTNLWGYVTSSFTIISDDKRVVEEVLFVLKGLDSLQKLNIVKEHYENDNRLKLIFK